MRFSPLLLCGALLLLSAGVARGDYRLAPEAADAGDGIELTPWLRVKPYLRVTAQYTSNLLQERNHRTKTFTNGRLVTVGGNENDVAYSLIGGVDLLFEAEEGTFLEIGYNATQLLYTKHPELNTVEQRARFAAGAVIDKLTLSARGTADWGISNTDPQFSGRIRNFRGSLFGDARYQVNKVWGGLVEGKFAANENFPREVEPTNAANWGTDMFVTITPNMPTDLTVLVGGGIREIHYFDHKATNPDISLASATVGVELAFDELVTILGRVGYEYGWVKKRNEFSRQNTISDGLRGSLTVTAQPLKTTTLTVGTSHQIGASGAAAYQRETVFFGRLDQELPLSLRAYAQVTYALQEPRHNQPLRAQSYRAGVGWSRIQHLEVGMDGGYTRNSSRRSGFEAWDTTLSVTLRY